MGADVDPTMPVTRLVVGVCVLVVDDIAANREIAVAVLQAAKHDVDAVSDGEGAIEAVRDSRYDVVLMDVEMPVVDGLEATRRIRAREGDGWRIPIIALTAGAYREQMEACRAAGMDDHIAKPVNFQELRDKVALWSAHGRSERVRRDAASLRRPAGGR